MTRSLAAIETGHAQQPWTRPPSSELWLLAGAMSMSDLVEFALAEDGAG